MSTHLQGSLFDQTDDIRLGPLHKLRRTRLGDGAWIDLLPGWLSGADALFARLAPEVSWRAERRQMYEHAVDVPRLLAYHGADDVLPHPVLAEARDALSAHYAEELGSRSPPQGSATTGTAGTAWPGTGTGPGGARARTRWSPSSPWARHAICSCGPGTAAAPYAAHSATGTCS
ncbi:hypothetical protein GCM10023080_036270 [Streptomyces pseudoechinosporeus]